MLIQSYSMNQLERLVEHIGWPNHKTHNLPRDAGATLQGEQYQTDRLGFGIVLSLEVLPNSSIRPQETV